VHGAPDQIFKLGLLAFHEICEGRVAESLAQRSEQESPDEVHECDKVETKQDESRRHAETEHAINPERKERHDSEKTDAE
jgi:hypothetical protein